MSTFIEVGKEVEWRLPTPFLPLMAGAVRTKSRLTQTDAIAGIRKSVLALTLRSKLRLMRPIDGDTLWLESEKIRIADIKTPEVSSPECAREAQLGAQATGRLIALLNAGGFSLEKIDRDEDQYGRKLRIVTRDGGSLGDVLVEESLAEEWQGRTSEWC